MQLRRVNGIETQLHAAVVRQPNTLRASELLQQARGIGDEPDRVPIGFLTDDDQTAT
jgi:hypothetical protein